MSLTVAHINWLPPNFSIRNDLPYLLQRVGGETRRVLVETCYKVDAINLSVVLLHVCFRLTQTVNV